MEAVILIGIQAAGKTTFYQERFFHTHLRLSLDMLRTRRRLDALLRACLDAKQPFVLDNTNVTAVERAPVIALCRAVAFQVTGYYFEPEVAGSVRRNRGREGARRVPAQAIYGTRKRLEPPALDEGFDRLFVVRLDDGGFIVQPAASFDAADSEMRPILR